MSDILYIRNPFRDTGDVSAEHAWDILYERYQSQYDNKKEEGHAIYELPSIQDVYRYVKMKEELDKKTKQLEDLLLPILLDDFIFLLFVIINSTSFILFYY